MNKIPDGKQEREPIHYERAKLTGSFTQVPNDLFSADCPLSPLARYVLIELMSRKDGWCDNAEQMTSRVSEGRRRIAAAWAELRQHGYMRQEKYAARGKWYTRIHVRWTGNHDSAEQWADAILRGTDLRGTGSGISVSPGETDVLPGRTDIPLTGGRSAVSPSKDSILNTDNTRHTAPEGRYAVLKTGAPLEAPRKDQERSEEEKQEPAKWMTDNAAFAALVRSKLASVPSCSECGAYGIAVIIGADGLCTNCATKEERTCDVCCYERKPAVALITADRGYKTIGKPYPHDRWMCAACHDEYLGWEHAVEVDSEHDQTSQDQMPGDDQLREQVQPVRALRAAMPAALRSGGAAPVEPETGRQRKSLSLSWLKRDPCLQRQAAHRTRLPGRALLARYRAQRQAQVRIRQPGIRLERRR